MRTIVNIDQKWAFTKMADCVPQEMPKLWDWVDLPHSWNALDGQDGGSDYHRGTCYYAKTIQKADLPKAERYYLEIKGANSSAWVYLDGKQIASHDGGYSTWRVELTEHLSEEHLLVIAVDNAPNDRVYPQVADFTFYGGLYRSVEILCVPQSHFDLSYYGGPGIKVTPVVTGKDAQVELELFVTDKKEGQYIQYTVYDAEDNEVVNAVTDELKASFTLENMAGRIPTCTPWRPIWWRAPRSWTPWPPVSVAAVMRSTRTGASSSMGKSTPCGASAAIRTGGVWATL